MGNVYQSEGHRLYECPECGLHYTSLQIAQRCEAWCKEHNSCNLEITRYAVELQN
jgi:hypothetical protein